MNFLKRFFTQEKEVTSTPKNPLDIEDVLESVRSSCNMVDLIFGTNLYFAHLANHEKMVVLTDNGQLIHILKEEERWKIYSYGNGNKQDTEHSFFSIEELEKVFYDLLAEITQEG